MEDLLVATNIVVFKSLYGRIRITKSSALGKHLAGLFPNDECADDYIYINNENDFMGQRASALVNMTIFIKHSGGGVYLSVVDLQNADPYKPCWLGGVAINDCDSGFRSLCGSGRVYCEGTMHTKSIEAAPPVTSPPSISSAFTTRANPKRSKKRPLPKCTSTSTAVQLSAGCGN